MNVYLLLPLISHLIDEAMEFPQFLQAHTAVLGHIFGLGLGPDTLKRSLGIRELLRGSERSCRVDPRLFKRIPYLSGGSKNPLSLG